MEEVVDPRTPADDCCVDCGKGVSPHQAETSRRKTQLSRAFGDSRNRDGFVLCRKHLDRETGNDGLAAALQEAQRSGEVFDEKRWAGQL